MPGASEKCNELQESEWSDKWINRSFSMMLALCFVTPLMVTRWLGPCLNTWFPLTLHVYDGWFQLFLSFTLWISACRGWAIHLLCQITYQDRFHMQSKYILPHNCTTLFFNNSASFALFPVNRYPEQSLPPRQGGYKMPLAEKSSIYGYFVLILVQQHFPCYSTW